LNMGEWFEVRVRNVKQPAIHPRTRKVVYVSVGGDRPGRKSEALTRGESS